MKDKKQHKDLHYPFRGFRIADDTYEEMKQEKEEGETWNKFFKRIIKGRKDK
jgi:predicted CopG family antitoxin